jgi:hypothetical protein
MVYVTFESPGRERLVLGPYRSAQVVGGALYVLEGREPVCLASRVGDAWQTHGPGAPARAWEAVCFSDESGPPWDVAPQ